MKKVILVLFLAACFITPNMGTQEVIAQSGGDASYKKVITIVKTRTLLIGGVVVAQITQETAMGCDETGGTCLPAVTVTATPIQKGKKT